MSITLKEIAELAGVSVQAIETHERIEKELLIGK